MKYKAEYYKATIVRTGKPMGNSSEGYSRFDDETKTFATLAELKSWLKEQYNSCKRQNMYRDGSDKGEHYKVGYVYAFNNADWSHSPVEKWHQQDWVEVSKCVEVPAL